MTWQEVVREGIVMAFCLGVLTVFLRFLTAVIITRTVKKQDNRY
jgi:hypothetical protein